MVNTFREDDDMFTILKHMKFVEPIPDRKKIAKTKTLRRIRPPTPRPPA